MSLIVLMDMNQEQDALKTHYSCAPMKTDTVLIYDISRSCTAEITILDTFAFDSVAAVMEAQLDSIEQATYSDPSFFYTAIYASGTISDSIGLLFVSYNADVDYRQYDDETNLMLLIDDGASLELVFCGCRNCR